MKIMFPTGSHDSVQYVIGGASDDDDDALSIGVRILHKSTGQW